MNSKRRLAAIVFTDIKGYSSIASRDEGRSLNLLEKYRTVVREVTALYHGRLIHFYGDGSLTVHENALEAVQAAIAMQQHFMQNPVVPVRIGVHLGEIVERDESVFGNAVNVAARLQHLGTPKAVLVSGAVASQLSNHPGIKVTRLGKDFVKNIKEEIEVFAINDNDGSLVMPAWKTIRSINTAHKKNKLIIPSIVLVACLLIAYFLSSLWNKKGGVNSPDIRFERLLVMPFENIGIDSSLNALGNIACHYLTSGLDNIPDIKIISFESILHNNIQQRFGIIKENEQARNIGASLVLNGQYYLEHSKLDTFVVFKSSLFNYKSSELIYNFPEVRVNQHDFTKGLQDLLKYVLGYFLSRESNPIAVPAADAYKAYSTAIHYWKSDYDKVKFYLKKAIKHDSSFLDAYFLLFEVYYIENEFDSCESIFRIIDGVFLEENFTKRQRIWYNYDKALLERDLHNIIDNYISIYKEDPREFYRNTSMAYFFLDYANAPDKTIETLMMIPFDELDFIGCDHCLDRIDAAITAYINLGEIEDAISMIRYYPQSVPYIWHYEIQLLTYAFARDTIELNEVCDQVLAEFGINSYRQLLYNATVHFKLLRDTSLFERYLEKAFDEYQNYKSAYYGDLLIWKGQLQKGLDHFNLMLTRYPDDDRLLFRKANTLALLGRMDEAERMMSEWDSMKGPYDYGWTPYRKAVVYTSLRDTGKALLNLRQAVLEGRWFRYNRYEFDPDLLGIMDTKEFDEIIHPLSE